MAARPIATVMASRVPAAACRPRAERALAAGTAATIAGAR